MIFDLQSDRLEELTGYDVCVIGAGPAGITLALKMSENGHKVLLLEAGGLEYSQQSQEIYQCEVSARQMWPESTRLRFFGGTSNHWAGRCRPFEESDFYPKEINGVPGWPIRYDEISAYLPEAMRLVDLPAEGFVEHNKALDSNFKADAYTLSLPTRFGPKYFDTIKESNKITLILNANVYKLIQDMKGVVTKVLVKNYKGDEFQLASNFFVLAMGAVENARFLLNQSSGNSKGIGNDNGLVGRCFMEHLNIKLGEFILKDEDGRESFQFFTSDAFCEYEGVGKANLTMGITQGIKSYGRTAKIKNFFKKISCEWGVAEKIQFVSDFDCPGTGVITTLIEQAPNKSSYVGLVDETDSLGLKKAKINWEITPEELEGIKSISLALAKGFARSGLGMVKLEDYILKKDPAMLIAPHAHHMGTTRTSKTAEYGVVNTNCQVFGVDNLYVAGSSIFSTGGGGNPTMPILQFALRLADHLQARLS